MPVLLVTEELSGPIIFIEGMLESKLFKENMSNCFLFSDISR